MAVHYKGRQFAEQFDANAPAIANTSDDPRARPYDRAEPRVLQATRIAGDPATELAPTTSDERAAGFQPSTSNR